MAKLDLGFASTDWVAVRIGSLPDLLTLQNELERGRIPVRIQLPEFSEGLGAFTGETTLYVPRTHAEDAERVAQRLDPKHAPEQDPRHVTESALELDTANAPARSTEHDAPRSASALSVGDGEQGADERARSVEHGRSARTANVTTSSSSATPDAELERTRALARRIRYCMPSLILAPVCLALAPRYLRSPRRRDLMPSERWATDAAVALALPAMVLGFALLWMLIAP
ncbi:MAG: hypothetical protein IPJ77_23695 [Planctomycetes bacterium]|nr:hypothetical protein [Planctomycetota bacterium]